MTDMGGLPDPLVPADCDVRNLDGFLLNVERLMASELVALASHEEISAALMLWCRAWKQLPAASLPDDDRVLAAYARLSMSRWRKVRNMALRGFVRCSDGRLYHKVLAEEALHAFGRKLSHDKRRRDDAERLRQWREQQRLKRSLIDARNGDETVGETRFVAEGQGQGQGHIREESLPPTLESLPRESAAESNPDPKPEAEAPKPKPRMPRPDEPLPPPTPAEALCRDLADIRDALWPPVNGWHPGATDLAAAARWLDRWTHAGIVDAARSAMEGKHRADSRAGRYDPISSLARYLGPILERELAAAAPPPPPDAPVSAEVLANRAKILGTESLCRQVIEEWKRHPHRWNGRIFGPPPDEPGCEIKSDWLRKAGITPHPGVAQ